MIRIEGNDPIEVSTGWIPVAIGSAIGFWLVQKLFR